MVNLNSAAAAAERNQDAAAADGNFRVHVHALTQQVLRQGSSLMTQAEARAEALRLFRRGIRATPGLSL